MNIVRFVAIVTFLSLVFGLYPVYQNTFEGVGLATNIASADEANFVSASGSIPFIDAELDIELLDGEGFVEIGISLEPTEGRGGRGIEDAEVRLEGGPLGIIILLKKKDNPTSELDVSWKVPDYRLQDILPNGSYMYIIDYGPAELFEFPFEITGDFPPTPVITQPLDGATVRRNFIVRWQGALADEYWLEFGSDDSNRGGSELSFEQVFGLQPRSYRVPRGLFGSNMHVEIILTANKSVYSQVDPDNAIVVLKGTHIDMDVTTR